MRNQSAAQASPLRLFADKYISAQLEFRVRLFNILASFGVLVSLLSAVTAFILDDPPAEYITYLCFGGISLALIVYSTRTGRYQRCYTITTVLIFLIGFPAFFFLGGSYFGAIPYFFIFAVLFTIFMLEGKRAIVMSALELALYIAICVYARLYIPVDPIYFDPGNIFFESVFGFTVVSVSLGVCMFLHFRLYNRQQRELKKAREDAEAANDAKSRFLANMSHEIRTPIGIMLGMNEMIMRESDSEQIKGYVRSAENAGQQLLTLINNILDVSAIEKGKLTITEERFETAQLISALSIVGENLAQRRNLRFKTEMDEALPRVLTGDMPHIRQIVTNFLSNAAKYTEKGGVTLSFSAQKAQNEGEIALKIAVADTGLGIKTEDIPFLFDTFTRGDAQGRYIEGSGLGLAIAKEYAERMDGRVHVESEAGHGSVFTVEMPLKIGDYAPIGKQKRAGGAHNEDESGGFTAPGCDILVVDDNAENRKLIKTLLERTLMRIDAAESGAQCLNMAAKRRYDAILMDYMMPEMDGAETLGRLKALPGFDTPVIALTANVVLGVREALMDAGFRRCLSKPVVLRELEAALMEVLPRERVTVGGAAAAEQIAAAEKDALALDLYASGVDLDDGLGYVGGDIARYGASARIFADSCGAGIDTVRGLWDGRDWESMRFRAHSLMGNARNIGANALADTAAKLERLCELGDGAYIGAILPALFIEWERANNGLQAFIEKLAVALPERETAILPAPELSELMQMLKSNRYPSAMDALAALIEAGEAPERREKLRRIRQSTDELNFREAERLLAALMESEAKAIGD